MTFSRADSPQWDFEPLSLNTADAWPRSKEDVLSKIIGYRIRVEGPDVDVMKDAIFEQGSDEVTVSISIPVGDNYTVTVLALGPTPSSAYNLLGSGMVNGVNVGPESPVVVDVPMEPYRFEISAPETAVSGTTIPVEVTIHGNLELGFEQSVRLHYQTTKPTSDNITANYSYGRLPTSGETVVFEIPGHDAGTTVYYSVVSFLTGWNFNGATPRLFYPAVSLEEQPLEIEIVSAGTGLVVNPVW